MVEGGHAGVAGHGGHGAGDLGDDLVVLLDPDPLGHVLLLALLRGGLEEGRRERAHAHRPGFGGVLAKLYFTIYNLFL